MAKNKDTEGALERKLDVVIHLLEDLFIRQALSLDVGRNSICSVVGVRTARVSNIRKGLNKARQHDKK